MTFQPPSQNHEKIHLDSKKKFQRTNQGLRTSPVKHKLRSMICQWYSNVEPQSTKQQIIAATPQ